MTLCRCLKRISDRARPAPPRRVSQFSGPRDVNAIAAELDVLTELATKLNRLPGVSRRNPEAWHLARDEIARSIARAVGRLRKELGIRETATSFAAKVRDEGLSVVRLGGRAIPVERRGVPGTKTALQAARDYFR